MKKLVIINFDDQYINVTSIIKSILISEPFNIEVTEDDIALELGKPISLMLSSLYEDCASRGIEEDEIYKFESVYKQELMNKSILSNGIQEFLLKCKELNIEVRIIANKVIDVVNNLVNRYSPNLISGIDKYNEPYNGMKLIEHLVNERNLSFKDVLIISSTDFNDEYLQIFEYSKNYCGDNIFNDYCDLLSLLIDNKIQYPTISASIDINVRRELSEQIIKELMEYTFEIDVTELKNSNDNLLVLNRIEKECNNEENGEMYLENLIDKVIGKLYENRGEFKFILDKYNAHASLCCVSTFESSKVNPSLSLNNKILKFLVDTNLDIDYDVYC